MKVSKHPRILETQANVQLQKVQVWDPGIVRLKQIKA